MNILIINLNLNKLFKILETLYFFDLNENKINIYHNFEIDTNDIDNNIIFNNLYSYKNLNIFKIDILDNVDNYIKIIDMYNINIILTNISLEYQLINKIENKCDIIICNTSNKMICQTIKNVNKKLINKNNDNYNQCKYIIEEINSKYYSLLCDSISLKQQLEYNPENNNVKYLLVFASHCDSELKLRTIENNLSYFNLNCIDILFIISSECEYKSNVKSICEKYKNIILFMEKENDCMYDFGKFVYILENFDVNQYDNIVFTNDSIYIHSSIFHFFNFIYKSNKEFIGYNDSTQLNYNYQSYLFSFKK